MRKVILWLVVLGLCLVGVDAYAEITLTLFEPGFNYEIVGEVVLPLHFSTAAATDNEGNLYTPPTLRSLTIHKIDKYGNATQFARIDGGNLKVMSFDNIEGVMYCIIEDSGMFLFLFKITGFTPLSESQPIQDLQDQIDNIQLLPGPPGPQGEQGLKGDRGDQGEQGPAGIAPEEVAEMQAQIASLQRRNQRLQRWIRRITSWPPLRNWLRRH